MPKSADTSKTIRLKSSIVELIEQEAKRRGVSFLDAVYYIILHYFMQNNQGRLLATTNQTSFLDNTTANNFSEEEEEEEEEIEKAQNEDKPDFSNMSAFE